MSVSYKDLGLELSSDDSPPASPDSLLTPKKPIARLATSHLGKNVPIKQTSPIKPKPKKVISQGENTK